ncbi:Lrp/AsnC ligand binding domain-containing protein [Streptomyces sp. NPDC013978]|uniref:Lrp/AsnC ligand binding domain-containing protein n=1 Tax=Streptomyces sp. NPDC013978 TaxID=3364869 RepID=UPI0036F840DF
MPPGYSSSSGKALALARALTEPVRARAPRPLSVLEDGRPDYFLRVAAADHAAYEAFVMGMLSGLPAVLRLESHLTMKTIKLDG